MLAAIAASTAASTGFLFATKLLLIARLSSYLSLPMYVGLHVSSQFLACLKNRLINSVKNGLRLSLLTLFPS